MTRDKMPLNGWWDDNRLPSPAIPHVTLPRDMRPASAADQFPPQASELWPPPPANDVVTVAPTRFRSFLAMIGHWFPR